MKRYIAWLLTIITLLLVGCTPCDPMHTDPSGPAMSNTNPTVTRPTLPKPTEPKPTEPKPTAPKPTEPLPTKPKPTQPEPEIPEGFPDDIDTDSTTVAVFQELFGDRTRYAQALFDSYDDPRNVNIPGLFEFGFADEPPVTKEERAEIVKQTGDEDYSWMEGYRLPLDKMNTVLQTVFGLTLDDMNMVGGHLKYLESTNCYYRLGGGSWYVGKIHIVGTKMLDTGNIELYYQTTDPAYKGVVILKPVEDGYHIVSNRWFE